MILLYITLGYLLSGVGYGLYHKFIRPTSNATQRKLVLYVVVALSLILPVLVLEQPNVFQEVEHHAHQQDLAHKKFTACYKKASSQIEFCKCEANANLVAYQPNTLYNGWLFLRLPMYGLLGIISLIVLVLLAGKLAYLHHLKQNSELEIRIIEDKVYHILRYKGKLPAASFRLFHSYIIWHPMLDKWSQAEQDAIINHEISHLEHRDTWQQIGLDLLQTLWLLNPIFYLLKKEFSLLNEYIADAFAAQRMGNSKGYASLLIKLKEQQSVGLMQQVGTHPFKARILALFHPPKTASKHLLLGLVMLITVFMSAISVGSAPIVNQQSVEFEEYCCLQNEYEHTGKEVFCKSCLLEDLEKGACTSEEE